MLLQKHTRDTSEEANATELILRLMEDCYPLGILAEAPPIAC